MTEEMQRRIEEASRAFDNLDFRNAVRSDCFKAGAKFILEMPELREALEFFAGNYLDGCKCSNESTCYLCRDYELLKKAGLCE